MKRLARATAMGLALAMAMAATASAAAGVCVLEPVLETVTFKGVVKVTRDGEKITKIEVETKSANESGEETMAHYEVAENNKSAAVAKLDGKQVEVKGTVVEKDDKLTITVEEVKEVQIDERVKEAENKMRVTLADTPPDTADRR